MSTDDFNHLVSEITAGRCIAFVGAGFSAQQVGGWASLIVRLAEEDGVAEDTRRFVARHVDTGSPSSRDLEIAAQLIADDLGGTGELADRLRRIAGDLEPADSMLSRIKWLRGIPFRAVLTTNFDNLLAGELPGRDAYLEALRPTQQGWWQERYWQRGGTGSPVIKLHGDVNVADPAPVLTRRAYRDLLYGSPAYTTFLKSLFSTTTILYLGFSFTDAYLNELRSEILKLLDHRPGDRPLAYALIANATDEQVAYMRSHEGIGIFRYDSAEGHGGFDTFLDDLWKATNPRALLGKAVEGRRILWLDPLGLGSDAHEGAAFLEMAADLAGNRTTVQFVLKLDEAIDLLRPRDHGWDLVITYWGHGKGRSRHRSAATDFLSSIREAGIRVPVIVFASGSHADENRPVALSLGAQEYLYSWGALFRELERLFSPAASLQ